jgi:hypothetical protein
MGKNSRFLVPFASLLTISAVSFSMELTNEEATPRTVQLSIVNNSEKILCIQDKNTERCSDQRSLAWDIIPQYFYQRDGVIRLSLNREPSRIAMFKRNTTTASLYIDQQGNIAIEPNTFEKGSFVYSDNSDYLYFAVKPFNLFGTYPV